MVRGLPGRTAGVQGGGNRSLWMRRGTTVVVRAAGGDVMRTGPGGGLAGPAALAFLLLLVPAGCTAQLPPPAVVLDGRDPPGATFDGEVAAPPALPAMLRLAEAHALGLEREVEEPAWPMSAVDGSFTAPGAAERLVLSLVSRWPRCCPMVVLALFRDGAPVAHWAFEGSHQALALLPGEGGDGRDAVFLVGSFGMGGDESGSASLLRFDDGSPVESGTLGLFESSCASGRPGATAQARVLFHDGGTLLAEEHRSDCGDGWERVGDRVPLELQAPFQATEFVALPVPPPGG
jgi:hypothetical protein